MGVKSRVFPKLSLSTNHSRAVVNMQIVMPPVEKWALQVHVAKDNRIVVFVVREGLASLQMECVGSAELRELLASDILTKNSYQFGRNGS